MDHEAVACAFGTTKSCLLVTRGRNGRAYLCLPRFERLLTMSFGPAFSQAMMPRISKAMGLDPDSLGLKVVGAGGAGEATNGRYRQQGTYNGRPIYRNERGHAIYFSGFWKIGSKDHSGATFFYSLKDAKGPTPPIGDWTTYGYGRRDAEPPPSVVQGDMPDAAPVDALFAWLFASQPPGALGENAADAAAEIMARVFEKPEHNTLDEVVRLLKNIDFDGGGGGLCPARPGIYASSVPCVPAAWLASAEGHGEWVSWDGNRSGEFRITVDTDLPRVTVRMSMGGDALKQVALSSYSMAYVSNGAGIHVYFTCAPRGDEPAEPGAGEPGAGEPAVHFEATLRASGLLEGHYRSGAQYDGSIIGRTTGEFRPHATEPTAQEEQPSETARSAGLVAAAAALDARRIEQPLSLDWQPPKPVAERRVVLVAVGGAPGSGTGGLGRRMLEALLDHDFSAKLVNQDAHQFQHLLQESAGMLLTPGSVRWDEFAKAIDAAVAATEKIGTVKKPGVVLVEGPLVYWMPELCAAYKSQFFLQISRSEVFRRQCAADGAASAASAYAARGSEVSFAAEGASKEPPRWLTGAASVAFVEHVAWPAHLAYGQPRGRAHELEVSDGLRAGPLSRDIMEKAVHLLEAELCIPKS